MAFKAKESPLGVTQPGEVGQLCQVEYFPVNHHAGSSRDETFRKFAATRRFTGFLVLGILTEVP
jgi:hypothetical protein